MEEIKNFSGEGGAKKGEKLTIETKILADEEILEAHINPKTGRVEKYFIKDEQGGILEFADFKKLRKGDDKGMMSRLSDKMKRNILGNEMPLPMITLDEIEDILNDMERKYLDALIDEDEETEN